MEKVITHTYKEVRKMNLTVYGNGACDKASCWTYDSRDAKNKIACFYSDSNNKFISELAFETSPKTITTGKKLFVASECKISRDTLRNSNYSITRDRTNAQFIVVPDILPHQYLNWKCNMVAMNEVDQILYVVDIAKYGYGEGEDIGDFELQVARDFMTSSMKLTVDDTKIPRLTVWFLPKCEELMNMITGNAAPVPYVQESKVPIIASTKISPETLVLWENISDENLFVRTICTSDWQDYPITLITLLSGFRRDTNWYNPATGDFRRILKAIGYEYSYYYYGDEKRLEFLNGKKISQKDYEMLQGYIYCRFGVDQNGGLMTQSQWEAIPECVRRILQKRVVVKPYVLPTRINCSDLASIMEK